MDKNIQQYCVLTLSEIWAQIDWDKVKGSRALGIWDEFTSKVKSAAMTTTNYETFVEKLCRKMDVRSLRFAMISEISELSEDIKKQILKCFRSETQIIILKLRLQNQIRKEQMQREKEAAADKED